MKIHVLSLFLFLQRWWRCCLLRQSSIDANVEEGAAVCLQAAWRSYRERRRFLQWRDSTIVIQRSWRNCCHRRTVAAVTVQAAWRGFRERSRFCTTYRTVMQLQAMCRGHLARLRYVKELVYVWWVSWVCSCLFCIYNTHYVCSSNLWINLSKGVKKIMNAKIGGKILFSKIAFAVQTICN